jgi:hypothetical protein
MIPSLAAETSWNKLQFSVWQINLLNLREHYDVFGAIHLRRIRYLFVPEKKLFRNLN